MISYRPIGLLFVTWLLTACATQYVPPADGRVSVIDLVMFGNIFVNKSVTSYGHLVADPDTGTATLFYHADHAARRGERFAVPVTFSEDLDPEKLKGCSGHEVLIRGTLTKTPEGISLLSGNDFIC